MTDNEEKIKQNLLSHFPNSVDKSGEVLNSIIEAMSYCFNKADDYAKLYSKSYFIDEFNEDMLITFTKFFGLPDMDHFTPAENLQKFRVLFERQTDKWGTIFDIITIFKKYYDLETIYLVENVSDEQLLSDGDFESQTSQAWVMPTDKTCYKSNKSCFEGLYGLELLQNGWAKQEVDAMEIGNYIIHFFMLGKAKIQIINLDDGSVIKEQTFNCSDWQDQYFTFKLESEMDIEVKFVSVDSDTAYIDYVRLSSKLNYPTFAVFAVFRGGSSPDTLYFNPETISEAHKNELKFINSSYFPGLNGVSYIQDALRFIVDYVRPVGVKCYGNVLVKQEAEQDDYVLNGVLYTFSGRVTNETYNTTVNKSVDDDGVYNT